MSSITESTAPPGGGLRVADLVAMRHLGIHVLAGDQGLNRIVEWTHVSELEDPGPWLEGGEMLIVNGFGVPQSGEDQARYVSRLAEHRVVALALGVRAPVLQPEMISAADRLGLPLLRLPKETPFVAISHLVASANQQAPQRRLVRQVRILDTLRLRDGGRIATSERFTELEDIAGYRLALLTSAGNPVLADWPWVPDELDMGVLVEDGSDQIVIPGGYALTVPIGSRSAVFLVALERAGHEPAGLTTLQHIVTVAALEVVEEYRQREERRRTGAELLAELLSETLSEEQSLQRLASLGMSLGDGLVLAAVGTGAGEAENRLFHRLCDLGVDHLMLRQEELYVLVADRLEVLETLADELGLSMGVSSRLTEIKRLALARRETVWSLAEAGGVSGRQVVQFASHDSFAHWFPADLDAIALMVDATLRPIIDYDEGHGTELLQSLTVFFRNQRKLRQAASELFVHEHTLSYRLKRIEAITSRNLNDLQDISELWLALKALPIVERRRSPPGRPT